MYVYVYMHKRGSRKIRASMFKIFTKRENYVVPVRLENNSMTYILCMYMNSYAWFVSNTYKPLYLCMYVAFSGIFDGYNVNR